MMPVTYTAQGINFIRVFVVITNLRCIKIRPGLLSPGLRTFPSALFLFWHQYGVNYMNYTIFLHYIGNRNCGRSTFFIFKH